jgi:tripartite-type tricarboxylate transporter receptor subunit TctC
VNWYMMLAPAGTPRPIVERLNAEINKAMGARDTRERIAGMGGDPESGTPEHAAEFLRTEYERWGKVIREAGIKAD